MKFKVLVSVVALSTASMAAQAVPIISVSAEGKTASQNAEAAFLATLASYKTETFEGKSAGTTSQELSIDTSVGIFTMIDPGVGGLCDNDGYNCNDGVAILSKATTPFNGRFAVKSSTNWLDSMDAQEMVFSPLARTTAVGFYITDPNDAGGSIVIDGTGFSFKNIFGDSLRNGKVFYVTISDIAGLGDLTFFSNNADDGYGLDNVTVASVPEPGTLALTMAGLLGLAALRRKVARQA